MVAVEHWVTQWGFPLLRWWEVHSNMKGHPANIRPRIDTGTVERRLWINYNGEEVIYNIGDMVGVAGMWPMWDGLTIASTRSDLSGEELRVLSMNRLKWVEHQTLTAHFRDGKSARIAASAVSRWEMEELHDAIVDTFLRKRSGYAPPPEGRCWWPRFTPGHLPLEPGEESQTREASESECRRIVQMNSFPIPSIHWIEPVRTQGRLGFGARHYLVSRILFVGSGVRDGMHCLQFHSYRPGKEGVVAIAPDFAFLKGFRVVESPGTYADQIQPLNGVVLPGLSIVADFRYGMMLPLTCTYVANEDVRGQLEALAESMRKGFLPLVGQSLSDAQLGLGGKDGTSEGTA